MAWLLALSALVAQQIVAQPGPDPALGNYGLNDASLNGCSFRLVAPPEGAQAGTVTTFNCEGAPLLQTAMYWRKMGPGNFLLSTAQFVPVARMVDESQYLELKLTGGAKYVIRRLDAPNLRRPMRLAVGWWTFGINGHSVCRLELRINGRIGDGNACIDAGLGPFAGGRWSANEAGVRVIASGKRNGIRFTGSGKSMRAGPVLGGITMVQD